MMSFQSDSRGVSEVLGAILVFGILIASLGLYQAFIVPQANQQTEFTHNQELQQDLLDLRTAIHTVERTGSAQSFSVDLAAEYSNRIVAINPPTPIGSLRTLDTGNVSLSNVIAVNQEERDYWNFIGPDNNTFESKIFQFEPQYNLFQSAPTTYLDHSVVHHQFDSGAEIVATGHRIIDGKRINLGLLGGDRRFTDSEANIELQPISTGTTRVPIEAAGGNLTIEVPTRLSEDKWEELLDAQLDENGGHVVAFEVENDVLVLELEQGVTYNLQMAKVGVGPQVEDSAAHYIVRHGGDEKAIEQGQEADLVVQVRDRFNNPVSGEEVHFSVIDGNATIVEQLETNSSDSDGLASATVRPEKNNETIEVLAQIDGGGDDMKEVTFRLTVGEANPSRFAEQLNPASGVIFEEAIASSGLSGGAESMDVTFNNTFESGITVEQIRVNVYVPQSPGGSGRNKPFPDELVITDSDGDSEDFTVRGGFESALPLDTSFTAGELKTYNFEFFDDGGNYEIKMGDYVILSFVFDDGSTSTYIISPVNP